MATFEIYLAGYFFSDINYLFIKVYVNEKSRDFGSKNIYVSRVG